jgi:hydrogenase maturation protease
VHRLDGRSAIPSSWRSPSSHLLGVVEAIELGSLLDAVPDEIVLFGVEAGDIDNGTGMSAPVKAATVRVAAEVLDLLGSFDA